MKKLLPFVLILALLLAACGEEGATAPSLAPAPAPQTQQATAELTKMTLQAGQGFEVQVSPSGGDWVYFQIDRANPLALSSERPFGVRYITFDGTKFQVIDQLDTIFWGTINGDSITIEVPESGVVRFRIPIRNAPPLSPNSVESA